MQQEEQQLTQEDLEESFPHPLEYSEKWLGDLYRAFGRREYDRRKPKKGRQGRSKDNRAKASETRRLNRLRGDDWGSNGVKPCVNCNKTEYIEDHRSGDVVCSSCGAVESERGIGLSTHFADRMKTKSKPYQKVVHFRQRLAQLLGRDPRMRDEVWEPLKQEVLNSMTREELRRMGKNKWAAVIKRVGIPGTKRLSANWIQARRRLREELNDETIAVPPDMCDVDGFLKRLCARYCCVAVIFRELLYSPQGERSKDSELERRNMPNVNYITLQLMRLESEEVFKEMAPYFPQLVSKKQPGKNNQRWKLLSQGCHNRFSAYGVPRTEETLWLNWDYKEFTREETDMLCKVFD